MTLPRNMTISAAILTAATLISGCATPQQPILSVGPSVCPPVTEIDMPERILLAQDLKVIEGVDPETGSRIRRIFVDYGEIREQSRACANALQGET